MPEVLKETKVNKVQIINRKMPENKLAKSIPLFKSLKKNFLLAIFFVFSAICINCGNGGGINEEERPFLVIESGRFDLNAIVQEGGSVNNSTALGSGSLSFSFTGDIAGSYSASGPLVEAQTDTGVGAILTLIEDIDFERFNEALSMLAILPTGNGQADVFVIGSNAAVDTLEPDLFYAIGPSGLFNGLFLNGIDIQEFWAGQSNFIEIADRAFVITAGEVFISNRDSTRITGTFAGTTHVN